MKKLLILIGILSYVLSCSTDKKQPKFTSSFNDLARHNQQPDWFQDAKMGIYFNFIQTET